MSPQKAKKVALTARTLGRYLTPAAAALMIVGLTTINGCSASDRSTTSRDDVMSQNAAEAEAAEAQMTVANSTNPNDKADTAKVAKDEPKTHTEKVAKEVSKLPTEKVAKIEKPMRKIASAGGGVFVVQVGAFKIKENAEKLQAKLKEAGYPVEMQSIEHSKNGLLHLIRFQPVASKAEAETVVEELHAKQDLHAQVLIMAAGQ